MRLRPSARHALWALPTALLLACGPGMTFNNDASPDGAPRDTRADAVPSDRGVLPDEGEDVVAPDEALPDAVDEVPVDALDEAPADAMDESASDAPVVPDDAAPADGSPDASTDASIDAGETGACTRAGEISCTVDGATVCVDPTMDRANCGACGTACPGDRACIAGVCACPMGQIECGGSCVDATTSAAHCGRCGNACGEGTNCVAGVCACSAGATLCGGACVDTATNDANCGMCGNACAGGRSCVMGACACPTGMTFCNGACIDLQSDRANCGACGTACPGAQLCNAGTCGVTCTDGRTVCGAGTAMTCVDTQTDAANCGACGTACPTGARCNAGRCDCLNPDAPPAPGTTPGLCGAGAAAACVDLSNDAANCGSCGTACPAGRECRGGTCQCTGGQLTCGTGAAVVCLDGSSDENNCGACGNRCVAGTNAQLAVCSAGACRDVCSPGYANCDNNRANGCEVDTRTNDLNCGACGVRCTIPGQSCRGAGVCACAPGLDVCGAACTNRQTDRNNCGACGNVCPNAQTCTAGSCVCPIAGQILCNGVCVDPQTDDAHCGGCDMACTGGVAPDTRSCRTGSCQCAQGLSYCGAIDRCVNTSTDSLNCGACGTICPGQPGGAPAPGGAQVCSGGMCGLSCSGGETLCGSGAGMYCANTATSTANCGSCGNACTGGKVCSGSACACSAGETDCAGTCRTLASDSNNCGACGNVCPGGTTCSNNQCVCSTAGTSLCPACPAMTSCDAGAMCRTLQSDNANCGACGATCTGTGRACANGACNCTNASLTYCAGVDACVDTQSDVAHCGTCTTVCTTGQTCVTGTCRSPGPTLVSVRTTGTMGGNGNSPVITDLSREVAVSANGRYVAFTSAASDLVANDTNGFTDVFLRDTVMNTTVRVSVSSAGVQATNNSTAGLAITPDGRYVAFSSQANNLVAGDTNNNRDVFVRDTMLNTTVRASISNAGTQFGGSSYQGVAISANGRYVAFATNGSPSGDSNGAFDIYVRDLTMNTTARATMQNGSTTVQPNGDSVYGLAISSDGRYVAYTSEATNLVTGDTNNNWDVFIRDMTTTATTRLSVTTAGAQATGGHSQYSLAMTPDARYVAFSSNATNLVTGDTNAVTDIFVRDRTMNTTTRVSVANDGSQANGQSPGGVGISDDGRYVAFTSFATNLAMGDTNANSDVFIRDTVMNTTTRVSVGIAGAQAAGRSVSGEGLSGDGTRVVFASDANGLTAGETNGNWDLFQTRVP